MVAVGRYKQVVCATGFGGKKYTREETEDFWPALVSAAGEANDELIVAISELFGFATYTVERALDWKGKVVLYVGDNQNVVGRQVDRARQMPLSKNVARQGVDQGEVIFLALPVAQRGGIYRFDHD